MHLEQRPKKSFPACFPPETLFLLFSLLLPFSIHWKKTGILQIKLHSFFRYQQYRFGNCNNTGKSTDLEENVTWHAFCSAGRSKVISGTKWMSKTIRTGDTYNKNKSGFYKIASLTMVYLKTEDHLARQSTLEIFPFKLFTHHLKAEGLEICVCGICTNLWMFPTDLNLSLFLSSSCFRKKLHYLSACWVTEGEGDKQP